MPSWFRIHVRFLDAVYHGRRDGGEPEWPPSPLRVFQALVAASASRWNERMRLSYAVPALEWLERQKNPTIVAVGGTPSDIPYRLYVPDNVGDKVAKSWRLGNEASIAEYRTEKDVRPTHLSGEAVHYLYPLPDDLTEFNGHRETLKAAARSITHLGWGIDMVAADADFISDADADRLPGHRWQEVKTGGVPLRAPKEKTLADLIRRHAGFLGRLSGEGFKPVPPLSCFAVVRYYAPTVAKLPTPPRPVAAFEIHRTIEEQDREGYAGNRKFRPYHPVRDVARVAGMLRQATKLAAEAVQKPEDWIDTFVLGHGSGKNQQAVGEVGANRFAYVPLPTVRPQPQGVVGSINRVLILEPVGGSGADAAWARRMLSGQELVQNQVPAAVLSLASASDWVIRQYTRHENGAAVWSTVTPVVLPGYDDPDHFRRRLKDERNAEVKKRLLERLDARIDGLLRKAIVQAGFSTNLADRADLAWRLVGFRPGLDLATRYTLPDHLRGRPRYHVRIRWMDSAGCPLKIRGPLVVGAGRYCGLGLFVADE